MRRCWWEFFLRYVRGYQPRVTPAYFTLGSAYHAFLAGQSAKQIAAISPEFAAVLGEAKRLYAARVAHSAPPLPRKHKPEELFIPTTGPLKGIYSSRPDRVEVGSDGKQVREFKTARAHYDNADLGWHVHGEVIGELYTTGLSEATVDVVDKGEHPSVRQYQVVMTPEKREMLENLIIDLHAQLRRRWYGWVRSIARVKTGAAKESAARKHFPRDPNGCVRYSKPCTFYSLCWEKNQEHHFVRVEKKEWRKRLL